MLFAQLMLNRDLTHRTAVQGHLDNRQIVVRKRTTNDQKKDQNYGVLHHLSFRLIRIS
jgi:hypothetical protein